MKAEQRNQLKKACGELLDSLETKPKSVKGKSAIFNFWAGVLETQRLMGQPDDMSVLICMTSGRLEDLVEMPA